MHPLYRQRRGGVLLHPTSLPGPFPLGQISHDAYRFIEFLQQAGINVWQMLPLGPTHDDGSPYLTLSVHAGNPALISLDWLQDRKLLTKVTARHDFRQHQNQLEQARRRFNEQKPAELMQAYHAFYNNQCDWLDDYSLFMAIREEQGHKSWFHWPTAIRDRRPAALEQARKKLGPSIEFHRFCQFLFFQQWQDLKTYAVQHGILLFGDMPIYVSHDSADVWAHRELFTIDKHGKPLRVAGVPPDYFSETGQRWGNPLYRWEMMQDNHFAWWQRRMQTQLALFDLIRIDHFRGLQAYWDIPAEADTAIDGHWVEAPGDALLETLHDTFPDLPLVAEDLGYITEKVHTLRQKFDLPGMKVLQFAFDGNPHNSYLPHQHEFKSVVYTGTHDNDTTLSWFQHLDKHTRRQIQDYFGYAIEQDMPWSLIRAAFASVSCLAIIPLQDLLGLGSEHRMNTPGTMEGNWKWRFNWAQIPSKLAKNLHRMLHLYGRI